MSRQKVQATTEDTAAAVQPRADGEAAASVEEAVEAAVPPTEQGLAELKAKVAQAQQYHDQLLRTAADFDNFKKRAARERVEASRYATEVLLQKLLPVLDNFEMAMAAAGAQNTTLQALQSGVAMIHQQLKAALAEAGLEEVDAALKPFDPSLHEAVSQEDSAEVPEGRVLRQMRKGYRLRERLLRPASVVVAKGPSGPANPAEPTA
jgi:molecular chaperone GrpE